MSLVNFDDCIMVEVHALKSVGDQVEVSVDVLDVAVVLCQLHG